MATTSRNRMFSSIQNVDKNHAAFQYGWSENAVISGNNPPTTGAFMPLAVDASGVLLQAGSITANISGYAPQSGLLEVAGLAVVTSGFNPSYASGQKAPFAIDNINGGELVVLSDLDASVDSVTTYPATATTLSNYVPSGSASSLVTGTVLVSNPSRIAWGIQNVGSGSSLFVKLGSAPTSTGSFTWILRAASSDYGADGGTFTDSPAMYRGDVSVSGSTRFSVWEM